MRIFLSIFIIVILSSICFSQKTDNFEQLDERTFEQQLEKLPSQITKSRWEFFYQKAVQSFENEDYQSAQKLIAKSRIIAEKLEENFLIGKSLRFTGKIETKLYQLSKASRSFEKASAFLDQVDESPELKLEVIYLLNDWAERFTNPVFIHDEFDFKRSAILLFGALNITDNSKLKVPELKTLTMINIANFFGIKGNYLTQIYWLEKANLEINKDTSIGKYKSNVFSGLASAYLKLGNVGTAESYLTQLEPVTRGKKTPRLIYLRLMVDFYTKINSNLRYKALDAGISLAKQLKDFNQLSEFYRTKMLTFLVDAKFDEAKIYVRLLEDLADSGNYVVAKLDLVTAKAVIAGFQGDQEKSVELFSQAQKILISEGNDLANALFLFNWEAKTANFQQRFGHLKYLCEKYLERVKLSNRQDFLPQIYFYLANAEFGLGNSDSARIANQTAIDLIEQRRQSDSAIISTGTIDKLAASYIQKIQFEISINKTAEGFYSSEMLKSRWLSDRISKTPAFQNSIFNEDLRKQIYSLSVSILENPDEKDKLNQLLELENSTLLSQRKQIVEIEQFTIAKNSLSEWENLRLNQTALISYVFTHPQSLSVFVFQSGKELRQHTINISEKEIEKLALTVQNQIKNGIFFREKGREIYDILLKPLNLKEVKHLIIVPDKMLWKIPFQTLSADGKKFLIEDYQISYAPSFSVLSKYLANVRPDRKSFQVFANSRFDNLYLLFADREAKSLALAYSVKPNLGSTIEQFINLSDKSDILHFSMHAEVDEKEPFNSFLAFRKSSNNPTGKLTVNDLIKLKLKNQSLVFLASCATDNVLNGEGLVSLAWGMMNAGATTVISAQWEANDESTEQFTQKFYEHYKQGFSGAESLQKASIEMIYSSDNRLNKPYNWGAFTINGDFR